MKVLTLSVLAMMIALAQSLALSSSLTALSLTLATLYKPANCFFGFFRRRSSVPNTVEEDVTGPSGPIQFPAQTFQQNSFFNPFAGGNRFLSPFPNIPGFGGGIFQPNRFQQPWFQNPAPPQNFMPSQNKPSPPPQRPAEFPSNPNAFNPPPPQEEIETSFENQPQINTEEAESFFTLLAETDENKCISRLVCELGADPASAGDLGTTISEIIGSLTDFSEGSKVAEYNRILQQGRAKGLQSCVSQFSACDEESYALMKSSQAEQDAESSENPF